MKFDVIFMLELFTQAQKNLRREGVRTFLTLIGVVIGIAAIVSLLSVGTGLNQSFTNQFEALGSNTIFVSPGSAAFSKRIAAVSGSVNVLPSMRFVL